MIKCKGFALEFETTTTPFMTVLQALFLGTLQGITEFLPVSSSGHLALAQHFLGLENLEHYITFDLICHLGTLFAIFAVYKDQIKSLFSKRASLTRQIIVATLPLFPLVIILKPIESLYNKPELLGPFFLLTSALLYISTKSKPLETGKKIWWKDALAIGVFQALSLLPGVSRSGSTISCACIRGWKRQEAVTFSFLLAIPAILGGVSLKLLQINLLEPKQHISLTFWVYFAGFITSFFIGYFALVLLIRLASKGRFMYFVWYCFLLGAATSAYFFITF